MNCRTCNYTLWNLPPGNCPECGSQFKPSDFEFTLGSVRFLCPFCSQAYYGVAQNGHLVPTAFTCVGCHRPVDMDHMVLTPAVGVSDVQTSPIEVPWIEKNGGGRLRRFFRTIGWGLVRPADLGRAIPPTGAARAAWWYMALLQFLTWMLQIAVFFVAPIMFARAASATTAAVVGYFATVIALTALIAAIVVPMWAGIAHMVLRSTGQTRGSYSLTLATICYASGPQVLTAIPFVGYMLSPIWWLIGATTAVKESQRTSAGRAALAVLPGPVIGVILLCGGYMGMIGWAISTARTVSLATQVATGIPAGSIAAAIRARAQSLPGPTPHPIQLLADGAFQYSDLASPVTNTSPATWTVSGVALATIPVLDVNELRALLDRVALLPAQGQAGEFRLADAVFYTGGLDITTVAPWAWVVVLWPDPAFNPTESPAWSITIGKADGTFAVYNASAFDAAFAEQNALRSAAGLPVTAHPRTVK